MKNELNIEGPICPSPFSHNEQIVLGHGSGGRMSYDLIKKVFQPAFDNPVLNALNDAGIIPTPPDSTLVMSTDSHVVKPLFFNGGDIGRLAICGTVNDLAMMGAVPLYLTAGFILEEGLEFKILEQVINSMCKAAEEAQVQIVAGDTKVVEKGKADGLYINTSGLGWRKKDLDISGAQAKPGDIVILSGSIGDHGIAVLEARGELGFSSNVQSDIAPLNHLVQAMLKTGQKSKGNAIHVMRDPTRGGLATSLNEIAYQSNVCIFINEDDIPTHPATRAACELLGFDPLYVANEGKLIAIIAADTAEEILATMKVTQYGKESTIIGEVISSPKNRVLMKTTIGSTRVVDMLSGEMLPRIC